MTKPHGPTVFLTWIEHRRTRAICERLEISPAELISQRRGVARYAQLAIRTLRLLHERRPRALLVQTPSQILGMLALLLRPLYRYRLILDAHNEAVEPYLHPSAWMRAISNFLMRRADCVIVSNRQLAEIVAARGGKALVLPDALPTPPVVAATRGPGFNIAVISTYAGDEPVEAIVEAARALGDSIRFHVTGNSNKCPARIKERLPGNVRLTGFLEEHSYWELLASADVIMDLTTMDHCLVCGAYEAVALGKPLVLSGNQASRELFAGFAEFCDNDSAGIAAAVVRLRDRLDDLRRMLPAQLAAFDSHWGKQAQTLQALLK